MSIELSIDAGVGVITLDRPDRMNAITTALATGLQQAIAELGADLGVNAILVRGAGGNFCAGGDFTEVKRLRGEGPAALAALFTAFRGACAAIRAAAVPVIAAVEGVAAAGGFELMQAADIVLVSDRARIADNHVNFGMIPGGGGTARLPRIVGRQRALGLLLSGDRISGAEAVALGLAYRCYPHDEFHSAVRQFAQRLAGRDRAAVVLMKQLVNTGLGLDVQDALDLEMAAVVNHIMGAAGEAGVEHFSARQHGASA